MNTSRRSFLKQFGLGATGLGLAGSLSRSLLADALRGDLFFNISLAQWSMAGDFFRGDLTNMDFPAKAKNDFGIDAIEYVNQFWKDKATDMAYLTELKQRTDDLGVRNVLIMVDGEGALDHEDAAERQAAVENHYRWIEAAKFLGCHSIRVNLDRARSEPDTDPEVLLATAVDGFGKLVAFGADHEIGVIIENHGGRASDAGFLVRVVQGVGNPYAGLLPDFGNYCIKMGRPAERTPEAMAAVRCEDQYDPYLGVEEMMPYAKGVSAKSHRFDENGDEAQTDFRRMLEIVKAAGFSGYVGIEYEGGFMAMRDPERYLSNDEGIRATKRLLERIGAELS